MICIKSVRKTYFTLMETLIALFILSILLVVIFTFFRDLTTLSVAGKDVQKGSFQMRYLETRLAYIFERISNENSNMHNFYFYTQPPNSAFSKSTSLIFTYNNGVRKDPYFSGNILGRLYVDRKGDLRLMTWPISPNDVHQYMHQEILLNRVKILNFRFYAAPKRVTNAGAVGSIVSEASISEQAEKSIQGANEQAAKDTKPEPDKWHEDDWPITHKQMPSIVEIEVEVKKPRSVLKKLKKDDRSNVTETYRFRFVLSSSKNYIYYPPV